MAYSLLQLSLRESSILPVNNHILILSSGGLEMLFSNQRKHNISLPATDEDGRTANLAFLVRYLCAHLMKDRRKELFVLDEAVYATNIETLNLLVSFTKH